MSSKQEEICTASLMREVSGDPPDCFKMTGRLERLLFTTPVTRKAKMEHATRQTTKRMSRTSRRAHQDPLLSVENRDLRLHREQEVRHLRIPTSDVFSVRVDLETVETRQR